MLITSCRESEFHEPPADEPGIALAGVAHFPSRACFLEAIAGLKNEGKLPKETKGITTLAQVDSLKSEYFEGIPEDTLIYSDLLKSVLNKNYEIAIGDVFFRITRYGTLLTSLSRYQWLREMAVDSTIFQYCQPITTALGYFSEYGLYEVTNHNNLYLFDSCRWLEERELNLKSGGGNSLVQIAPFASPAQGNWLDISCDRTGIGELWDRLWGFSISARNYFDRRNRVDVKFYAQSFLFYSEIGIKTKTQTRGWTGIWRKRHSDEIINGWEVLNFSEEWPAPINRFIKPHEFTMHMPGFSFNDQTGRGVWDVTRFADETWRTFNIFGINIDITNRDKLGLLWNSARLAGGLTVNFLNNRSVNSQNTNTALRVFPQNLNAYHSIFSLGSYERRHSNTRKQTLVINSGSGWKVSLNIGLPDFNPRITEMPEFLTVEYSFLPNSVMYGAARIGNTWRGVRITTR